MEANLFICDLEGSQGTVFCSLGFERMKNRNWYPGRKWAMCLRGILSSVLDLESLALGIQLGFFGGFELCEVVYKNNR